MSKLARGTILGAVLMMVWIQPYAQTANPASVDFRIEAQPLVDALNAWAQQAGLQLIWPAGDSSARMMSHPINGRFAPQDALRQLLEGSGLSYSFLDSQTVAVSRQAVSPTGRIALKDSALEARATSSSDSPEAGDETKQKQEQVRTTVPARTRDGASTILEEITITGTHIRGADISTAPLLEINRVDIERSGVGTVQKLIEQLPQNFGGTREDSSGGISPIVSGGNLTFSSSINLRGLGSDSSLVLINGRRLAPSGTAASYVDVSALPISAVERVEVLTDGASAIYGSDAVGGVVNFILRDEYDGAETSIRYGSVTDGDADQLQVSQLLGNAWDSGSVLIMYEYSDRANLSSRYRAYASDSDLRRFGGTNFSQGTANPGNITRGAQTYAIPESQDGTDLTPADLLSGHMNLQNLREDTDLLPNQKQNTVFISASQQLGGRATLFATGGYAERKFSFRMPAARRTVSVPATNPFYVNPFGDTENVSVSYSFQDDIGPQVQSGLADMYNATLGADFDMAGSWRGELYGSYSGTQEDSEELNRINASALADALADPDPETALNVFGDGSHTNSQTLAAISSGFRRLRANSTIGTVHMHADGDLFRMPGGTAKLAFGLEAQEASLKTSEVSLSSGTVASEPIHSDGDRRIYSSFAELYMPLIGPGNQRGGAHRLAFSLASRFDDYSDFGSTTNPKLAVVWQPIGPVTLRGTIGTAFKAPLLSQLRAEKQIFPFVLPDPASASGSSNVLVVLGRKPGLSPEESTIWTVGVDIEPETLPGVRAKLGYFSIDMRDRIRLPATNALPVLVDPIYASLVTRDPSTEEVLALFADPGFVGGAIPPDEVAAIVDARLANVAKTRLDGLDLLLAYQRETKIGEFDLNLNASYLLDYEVGITPGAPLKDVVNTIGNPARLRLRSTATWIRGGFSTSIALTHTGGYTDNLNSPGRRVGSWTTAGLQLAYSVDSESHWFDNTRIALSVENLFDQDPPFANIGGVGFDATNATALGRYASLQLTKGW